MCDETLNAKTWRYHTNRIELSYSAFKRSRCKIKGKEEERRKLLTT